MVFYMLIIRLFICQLCGFLYVNYKIIYMSIMWFFMVFYMLIIRLFICQLCGFLYVNYKIIYMSIM